MTKGAGQAPAEFARPLRAERLYQEMELRYPVLRMREVGATANIVGPAKGTYMSEKGYPAEADMSIDEVSTADFDAVIIPGGYAPDHMRRNEKMVGFVREMSDRGKTAAYICHAGWMPASAGILKGKTAASTLAIKDDVVNAGAKWVDREVVVDGNLISSRRPADLPAFCREIIRSLKA